MGLPSALPPGTVVGGHYTIGNLMNNGGFGAVYRGVDLSEGQRPCAIKETYDVTPAARRRALLEASVLFTVRSKQLPEVYDAFESNGRFYLVMQLIEGQNLLQVLRARVGNVPLGEQAPSNLAHGPCSEQEVLTWMLPIMEVLQELHSRNPPIMHRDIKPANIILAPDQTTVLVDFGLTRLYDPNVNTQTLGRAVTPGFSPLEQYVGGTNPQSDIYSLAATMYLLLTNRLPPAATSRTPQDTLLPPRQLNPALSARMEQALLKALALHAHQRFQNMREFMQAVRGPTFTAFADRTVPLVLPAVPEALLAPQTMPAAPQKQRPTGAAAATQAVPADSRSYQAVQSPAPSTRPAQKSAPQDSRSYQAVQPPATSTRPGQANAAQVLMPPAGAMRSLPSPYGQGCLWGLMQGVVGAVLVLAIRQEASFYLATLVGYGFYILAGFLTAYRGGSAWRGIWAGYWSGISSTIMFWIVFGVGLLFRAAQYMQSMHTGERNPLFSSEFRRALDAVSPQYPKYTFLPTQPAWVNLLVLLGAGLLMAMALGGYGGFLGQRRFQALRLRKQAVKV